MANSSGVVLIINSQLNTAGLEAQVKQETLKLSKEATIKANLTIDNNGKSIQIAKQRISTFTNEAGQEVVKLTENISKNGVTVGKTVEMLGNKLKSTQPHIKSLKNSINDLFDTAGKVAKFSLITTALNTLSQAFTDGVQAVKAYDDALTDFQKVSDLSGDSLEKYAEKLGTLGESVARTRTEMVEGATGYKQSGYSDEDSAKLAQYSALLQNISDEEISASDATSFIISQLKAFGDQLGNTSDVGKQTLTVLDALNTVSNNYAVSSSDLEQGLKNLASTSSAMGNSYEETLGMLTAVTEITRNASVASRGLRQVFSRLTQTLDDSSSTGKKLVKIYGDLGIKLKDENGEIRSSYDILKDLSKHWQDLSKDQQEYIAITSAGANQVNNFLALMTNFGTAVKATRTALNSSGSAWEENSKYMESTSAKMNLLKGQFEELVLGNGGLVKMQKTLLDVGIALLQFANSDVGQTIIQIGAFAVALAGLNKAISILPSIIQAVSSAFTALSAGMLATPAGQLTAVILALGSAIIIAKNAMDYASKSAERMADALEETQQASDEAKNKLEGISEQLKDTKQQIEEIQNKGKLELTDEQKLDQLNRQYINLQNQYKYQKLLADEAEREAKAKLSESYTKEYKTSINTGVDKQEITAYGNSLAGTQTTTYTANVNKSEEFTGTAQEIIEKTTKSLEKYTDQINQNSQAIQINNQRMSDEVGNQDEIIAKDTELRDKSDKLLTGYNQLIDGAKDYIQIVKQQADTGDEGAQKIYDAFMNLAQGAEIASDGTIVFDESLDEMSDAVEEASEQVQTLADLLASLDFSSVDKALSDIEKDGKISADSIVSISKALEEAGVNSTSYVEALTDANTTTSEQKDILNDVATQILLNSDAVKQLNADNVTAIGQYLELQGVENGVIVAEQLLAEKQNEASKTTQDESQNIGILSDTAKNAQQTLENLVDAQRDVSNNAIQTDASIKNLNDLGNASVNVAKTLSLVLGSMGSIERNGLMGKVVTDQLKNNAKFNSAYRTVTGINTSNLLDVSSKLSGITYNPSSGGSAKGGGGGSRSGGSSSGKSDAEKAQEEALKAYKENAQKAFKENEHLYNMGQRSAKEYYEELARLNKQYYGETSQYASDFLDEFQSNEEKVYQGFKKLAKDALNAKKNAIKRQKEDLQDEQDDEEDYYNDRIDRLKEKEDDLTDAIEEQIDALKEKEDDLTDAIEEQIDALEDKKNEIADYWEKRIDALDETNDKLERQIQLEKYEQALAVARAKNVKVFKDGRFVWTSDQDAINSAQDELNTYKRKLAQEDYKKELESQRDAEIKIYDDEIDALKKKEDNIKKQYEEEIKVLQKRLSRIKKQYEEEIKVLQKRLSEIKKYYQEEEDELDDLGDAYDDMADKIESFAYDTNLSLEQNLANFMKWATGVGDATQQAISSMSKASEAEKEFASNIENFRKLAESGEYGNKTAEQLQWEYQYSHGLIDGGGGSTSGGTTSSGGIGPGYSTSSGSTKSSGTSSGSTKSSGSSSPKGPGYSTSSGSSSRSSGGYTSGSGYASNGSKIVTNRIVHRASGDASLSDDDIAVVGENPNKEIIIGSKLNNGVLMHLSKGTGVVNAQSTNTLAGMLNSIGTMSHSVGTLSDRTSNVNQNFHFDNLTLPNVSDANSFVKELSQRFNNYAIQYANVRK